MIRYESECRTVTTSECRTVYDTEYDQECSTVYDEVCDSAIPTYGLDDNSLENSASAVDSYGASAASPCRSVPRSKYIQALLSLVELLNYCALIGRELHSDASPALLCHKEPAPKA